MQPTSAPAQVESLVSVMDLIRGVDPITRPELIRLTGLGRTVVNSRIDELLECALVTQGGLAASTGGRAPRRLRLNGSAGLILVAELNSVSLTVGLADLSGAFLDQREQSANVPNDAEKILGRIMELFDEMLSTHDDHAPLRGIGIGMLGPVDQESGLIDPISPISGWTGFPLRDRLAARYNVPVWVDNEVNLMAIGELRAGHARGQREFFFVKLGPGIGAGIVSRGELLYGDRGAAGEIGHISVIDENGRACVCGRTGCLVTVAGEPALREDAELAARAGQSEFLLSVLTRGDTISIATLMAGVLIGDRVSLELLTRAAEYTGRVLAELVNALNPALILIGGSVVAEADFLLATIRRVIYERALPLASRDLEVAYSPLSDRAGLVGATFMVTDHLFSPEFLPGIVFGAEASALSHSAAS